MDRAVKVFGRCTRCETIPDKLEELGSLYLWFPLGHTLAKVFPAIQSSGLECRLQEDDHCMTIVLDKASIPRLTHLLKETLTNLEMEDTRVLFVAGRQEPQLRDFSKVISLQQFIGLSQSDWLIEMLSQERVTSYFQPIVQAQDLTDIFGHEALLRGIDPQGNVISPGKILGLAKDAGLLFQVDLIARRSAIREAIRQNLQTHLFINFSPTAVYDPRTCLRMTVRAIDEANIPHDRIVFEVIESDSPQDISHLKSILRFYQDAGFLVALDDFGAGYSNLNLIYELRPDFIKLDMNLIRNVHQDSYKALITEKILEITQHLNIQTIAEGIECAEELAWVQERGATFVQGYFIAKPAASPVHRLQCTETGCTVLAS